MRILANILRTFKVSSRESCKITNRRYSSQICPRFRGSFCGGDSPFMNVICVRSFTTTLGNCKNSGTNETITGSPEKGTTNQIVPVALLKSDNQPDAIPVKILVVPINLFNGDDEAVQKTMSTMSVLRDFADQIEAFTENATSFSKGNLVKNKDHDLRTLTSNEKREKVEPIWQDFDSDLEPVTSKYGFKDGLDDAIAEYEFNRIEPKSSFNTIDWDQSKRRILSDVPRNLEKSLGDVGIASMNLAFEMDMTNIKDAIHMHDKGESVQDSENFMTKSLKDPTLTLTTCVESDLAVSEKTVPLNFNALIQGTVNIDSSLLSKEQLQHIKVPQFNDYVTAIAANICSTALQKGFPADISRMYSTKQTSEAPTRPRSPHVVCVREGDKGCVSPGNADLDPYVPKKQKGNTSQSSGGKGTNECQCQEAGAAERTLLTSTIIGDTGARGLMSCKAYALALKEAARLREQAAAAKKSKDCPSSSKSDNEMQASKSRTWTGTCGKGDKKGIVNPCSGDRKQQEEKPPCDTPPCGPPRQDSTCRNKPLKEPDEKPPGNNPCRPQDAPCRRVSGEDKPAIMEPKNETKDTIILAKKDGDPPCRKLPYNCPFAPVKDHNERKEEGSDPCRINHPKSCPPSTSVGTCKRRVVDPCAPHGVCPEKKEEIKPKKPPCTKEDPCKKKKASGSSETFAVRCDNKPAEDSKQQKINEIKKPDSLPDSSNVVSICGIEKKPTAPNCKPKGAVATAAGGDLSSSPASPTSSVVGQDATTSPPPSSPTPSIVDSNVIIAMGEIDCASSATRGVRANPCAEIKSQVEQIAAATSGISALSATMKCDSGKKSETPKCEKDSKSSLPKPAEKKSSCQAPVVKFQACPPPKPACPPPKPTCPPPKPEPPKCTTSKPEASKCPPPKPPCPPPKPACPPPKPACPPPKPACPPPKCGPPKPEPPKCAAAKPALSKCPAPKKETTKCASTKKVEPPKCAASKVDSAKSAGSKDSTKSDCKKASQPSKSGSSKGSAISKCGGEKKPTAPNCPTQKKDGSAGKCGPDKKSASTMSSIKVKVLTPPAPIVASQQKSTYPNCVPTTNNKAIKVKSDITVSTLNNNNKIGTGDVTNCPTTVPPRTTAPNCPSCKRVYSTLFRRCIFTCASKKYQGVSWNYLRSKYGSISLGSLTFYSKDKGKKSDKIDTCPTFPPRPMHRKDVKRVPKDCWLQDQRADPCYKRPPKEINKTDCVKRPVQRQCWHDDDGNENKCLQNFPALLQFSGNSTIQSKPQQVRFFSNITPVKMQNENQTKYEIEEYDETDLPKSICPKPVIPSIRPHETINEIIKIGDAGEVLRMHEKIECFNDYDVLVRIAAIAISGTDIHVYETGAERCLGMTIGHDATGVIEKVGKCVERLKPGDCIAMESGLSCGICEICKQGKYNMCPQLFYNGFFSTYQTHPADLCYKIPENLTLEDATLTSTLALGCQACLKAHITPITNVLIIGTCPTACAAALCARALGAKSIVIISPNVYTLESIRILFDFDYIHYYENETNLLENLNERLCSIMKDRPNVVINYSINECTMNLSMSLLQQSGICVLAECDQEMANFNVMDMITKNITLLPSFRSAGMFPTALHLMKTGKTPIGELISRIYTWDQVKWAFHWAQYEANMGNRKVIVQCPENS